jgi:predicted 3-demethylubiquinone-9 3-methyltransferase (glyoxalase superfamily)
MALKQRITTFLWYDTQAEEAARHYASIFEGSTIDEVARYGDAGPGPKGTAMTVRFRLEGQEYIALNGGPHHTFTEAISLMVHCESQQEVDHYWSRLSEGGQEGPCGWLKDRFGLSWQVVPTALPRLLGGPDRGRANRVMQAMLQMKKLDVARLESA